MDATNRPAVAYSPSLAQQLRSTLSVCGLVGLASLLCLATGLWLRRSAMEPVTPAIGAIILLLVGSFGWLVRISLWATIEDSRLARVASGLISLAVVMLGLALSVGNLTPGGAAVLWSMVLLTEGSATLVALLHQGQRWRAGLLSGKEPAWPRRAKHPRISAAAPESEGRSESPTCDRLTARTSAPFPVLADRVPPGLEQQIERIASEGGQVTISALVCERFCPGQRHAQIHLAICPPLAAVPQVEVEQAGGVPATIKTAEVLPMGVRIELRLKNPAEVPEEVLLRLTAQGESLPP